MSKIRYYFTTYGDVYAGHEYGEPNFRELKIIVQASKWKDYCALTPGEKTLDRIRQFAHTFPVSAFEGDLSSDKVPSTRHQHMANWWQERQRKVMFIIGAGASAHCVTAAKRKQFENDALRPPLGNTLFSMKFRDLYDKYEGVKSCLFELQKDDANVEQLLEDEWREIYDSCNTSVMSRHINIQFYLQELLRDVSQRVIDEYSDCNLFAALADKLQKLYVRDSSKHYAFVSFNQDTILEGFLNRYFRRSFNNLNDYVEVNKSPYCVFKPHGSWNWGWRFPKRIDNVAAYLYEHDVTFFKLYFELLGTWREMIDWQNWGLQSTLDPDMKSKLTINRSRISQFLPADIGNFYPAILLPYRDKDEFTMPSTHHLCLERYFECIRTLIVIGWKGNEVVFNSVMNARANGIKKIVIVDPAPQIVEQNLKPIIEKPDVEIVHYSGFEDFITRGVTKELDS